MVSFNNAPQSTRFFFYEFENFYLKYTEIPFALIFMTRSHHKCVMCWCYLCHHNGVHLNFHILIIILRNLRCLKVLISSTVKFSLFPPYYENYLMQQALTNRLYFCRININFSLKQKLLYHPRLRKKCLQSDIDCC